MDTAALFVSMLVWLQYKHFVADYLLQPAWMLNGKREFRKPGGYVHAGLHAAGSMPAFAFGGVEGVGIVSLVAAEFAVHFLLDHTKAVRSRRHPHPPKDMLKSHVSEPGGNVHINSGADDLVLDGLTKADLHKGDFIF